MFSELKNKKKRRIKQIPYHHLVHVYLCVVWISFKTSDEGEKEARKSHSTTIRCKRGWKRKKRIWNVIKIEDVLNPHVDICCVFSFLVNNNILFTCSTCRFCVLISQPLTTHVAFVLFLFPFHHIIHSPTVSQPASHLLYGNTFLTLSFLLHPGAA